MSTFLYTTLLVQRTHLRDNSKTSIFPLRFQFHVLLCDIEEDSSFSSFGSDLIRSSRNMLPLRRHKCEDILLLFLHSSQFVFGAESYPLFHFTDSLYRDHSLHPYAVSY